MTTTPETPAALPIDLATLGRGIRAHRDDLGWTRAELVNRMPSNVGIPALTHYEQGVRQITVARLVEILQAMGLDAPRVASELIAAAIAARGKPPPCPTCRGSGRAGRQT